jgi:hypothetical protein
LVGPILEIDNAFALRRRWRCAATVNIRAVGNLLSHRYRYGRGIDIDSDPDTDSFDEVFFEA